MFASLCAGMPVYEDNRAGCIPLLSRTGTPGYMAGGPVRQPYAGVDFITQCRDL